MKKQEKDLGKGLDGALAGKEMDDRGEGGARVTKKSATAGGGQKLKAGRRADSTWALKKHFQYLVPQYRLILIKEPGVKPTAVTDPITFSRFIQPLAHYSEEHFIAFHLDAKHQVIGYHEVSKGTLNASLVHPREVFKAALLSNAYAIIVAHNHPSGSVAPSSEDLAVTTQLIKVGKLMGVPLVDHCIVSSDSMNSLRETEPQLWFAQGE